MLVAVLRSSTAGEHFREVLTLWSLPLCLLVVTLWSSTMQSEGTSEDENNVTSTRAAASCCLHLWKGCSPCILPSDKAHLRNHTSQAALPLLLGSLHPCVSSICRWLQFQRHEQIPSKSLRSSLYLEMLWNISRWFRRWDGLQEPNTKLSDSEKPDQVHNLITPKYHGN